MYDICPRCGQYSTEKEIDPSGPFLICPFCSYAQPFSRRPLFILTGASGAGKSTLALSLTPLLHECVVLDSDILWGALPATPEKNYTDYHNLWLMLAANIGQSGRPVVLCNTSYPTQLAACPASRYFSALHFLALVCDAHTLEERLLARPNWRKSGEPEFIKRMLEFNEFLQQQNALPPSSITHYDTSRRTIEETTTDIAHLIRQLLEDTPKPANR